MKLPARRYAIGLTGGIGSGKSTVADLFATHGVGVIDTDLIAHQLTAPSGAAMPAIAAQFGADYVAADGAMDRARMRDRVFADAGAKRALEAILHPLIGRELEQAAAQADGPYLMFAVPLLVESGRWRERVARILVVDCPESVQIERVRQRNGFDLAQINAIMATQASRAQRLAAADDVIDNTGDLAALTGAVARLHADYCAAAARLA